MRWKFLVYLMMCLMLLYIWCIFEFFLRWILCLWGIYLDGYICDACQPRTLLAMKSFLLVWSLGICVNVVWSKFWAKLCACKYFRKRHKSLTSKVLFNYDTWIWESRNTCRWHIPKWEALAKRPMTTSYSTWLLVVDLIQSPLKRQGVRSWEYMAQVATTRFCDHQKSPSTNM